MRQKCSRYVHIVYVLYLVSCTESLILRQIDGEPDVIGLGKYVIKVYGEVTKFEGGGTELAVENPRAPPPLSV